MGILCEPNKMLLCELLDNFSTYIDFKKQLTITRVFHFNNKYGVMKQTNIRYVEQLKRSSSQCYLLSCMSLLQNHGTSQFFCIDPEQPARGYASYLNQVSHLLILFQ